MTGYEKCKARPWARSEHRCTRALGHTGDHVDSKVGRYSWPNNDDKERGEE